MKRNTLRKPSASIEPRKTALCKVCKTQPRLSASALVCGPECAEAWAIQLREKEVRAAAKRERALTKVRREALKDRSDWIKDAQVAFNAFIRARDADKPCICCGKPFELQKLGGSMDAGHYLSRGSSYHLRFNELNVHGQRKNCNRPGGTTRNQFRKGMIARIGLDAVEALEADQTPAKWTIDELKAIKALYKDKLKALKMERGI